MVWEELLIGEGFWFGLIIILALLFIVTYVVKDFGWLGAIICIFMVIYYNNNLQVMEFKNWGMILMGISSMFLIFMSIGVNK